MAVALALVQEFRTVLREQDVPGFYRWLRGVELAAIPELCSVARGIWSDRHAVEAAVALPWSQGQTEGQVNRLKTLKRQMYGRATFALLRCRMLYPA